MVVYEDWEPYYESIRKAFGFSRERDEEAAHLLSSVLPTPRLSISELRKLVTGRTVYIFGAHESVVEGIDYIIDREISGTFVAADGASTAMRERGLKPDLIVSDLDGNPDDLLYWNREGVPLIAHAHGDNIERIHSLAPVLRHSMATTQSRPFDDVHNFGGFTDGDRCVFTVDHFGAFRIVLSGFRFDRVGRYSFTTDSENKLRKLRWAERLIRLFEVEFL